MKSNYFFPLIVCVLGFISQKFMLNPRSWRFMPISMSLMTLLWKSYTITSYSRGQTDQSWWCGRGLYTGHKYQKERITGDHFEITRLRLNFCKSEFPSGLISLDWNNFFLVIPVIRVCCWLLLLSENVDISPAFSRIFPLGNRILGWHVLFSYL